MPSLERTILERRPAGGVDCLDLGSGVLFGVNADRPCARVPGSVVVCAELRLRVGLDHPVWTGRVASADGSLTTIMLSSSRKAAPSGTLLAWTSWPLPGRPLGYEANGTRPMRLIGFWGVPPGQGRLSIASHPVQTVRPLPMASLHRFSYHNRGPSRATAL